MRIPCLNKVLIIIIIIIIKKRGPSGLALGSFENWNFGNAISCDLVIKFLLQFW